ncbi:MAG: diguanylate cyclase domain-containing protein, partial [Longimicrobiales bacterium]
MASERTIVYFGAGTSNPPELVTRFARKNGLLIEGVSELDDVQALINRSFPACVAVDASGDPRVALDLCRSLKEDAFTAIVPVVLFVPEGETGLPARGLEAGADEVITAEISEREQELRLELVLRRAARDVSVHPTTRLPGTVQIERDLAERLATGKKFAVCYADLDHFKEFNDRYGYNHGDGVILLVSKILRDLVRALAPGGFVGHIGGDDFIFNVDLNYLET